MKMMNRTAFLGAAVGGLAFVSVSATAESFDSRAPLNFEPAQTGINAPDVWVCSLPDAAYWGTNGGIRAFSIATTSANAGNINLNWIQNSQQHPVIAQNMYRLKDGILEMVGMSWLKHGFCSLQQTGCGNCAQPTGACLSILRPGCADPYDVSLNANANRLGPRSEVNPSTGVFTWPHSVGSGVSVLRSRLQVADADILPVNNPGARWFIEGQYVHPQDAQADLDNNNTTYREINVPGINFNGGAQLLSFLSGSFGMKAAIEGWADMDPDVELSYIDIANDGRFIVASRATENPNGSWHYEYAVFNMNSDRAAGSFSVPLPAGVQPLNVGFHDVNYHSGEIYDGTDWGVTVSPGEIRWETTSFDTNPNANALRWATMYNFRFDANAAPMDVNASLGLFKPGAPGDAAAAVSGPGAPICAADFNGDGFVNGADLGTLLANWGPNSNLSLDGDDDVDGADLAALLANWGGCN